MKGSKAATAIILGIFFILGLACNSGSESSQLPDLVVGVIYHSANQNCLSSSYRIVGTTVEVANRGTGDAGPFVVDLNGIQQDVRSGLAAGNATWLWFVYNDSVYHVAATVDANEQVTESNESNNTRNGLFPEPSPPPNCTPTPTPTTQWPTPTLQPCPTETMVPIPFVEPVTSPTNLLMQTIRISRIDLNRTSVSITSESGTFSTWNSSGGGIDVTLLPNTTHHLHIEAHVLTTDIGGCHFTGYNFSVPPWDQSGNTYVIVQQTDTITPAPTPAP